MPVRINTLLDYTSHTAYISIASKGQDSSVDYRSHAAYISIASKGQDSSLDYRSRTAYISITNEDHDSSLDYGRHNAYSSATRKDYDSSRYYRSYTAYTALTKRMMIAHWITERITLHTAALRDGLTEKDQLIAFEALYRMPFVGDSLQEGMFKNNFRLLFTS